MMKKYIKSAALSALLLVGTSCELDLLDNPNEVPLTGASPDFVINGIQVNFASFFENMSEFGMDNTRMNAMFGSTYENAYQGVNFDVVWTTAYSSILSDAELMLDLAAARPELDLSFHTGVAHFFKAYTAMTLVDYFGDIPFSQALDANILNPAADDGADVYASALESLDLAIASFEAVTDGTFDANPGITDLYYGASDEGDVANWLAACNTLKLRAYLQTRLVTETESASVITSLLDDNLIDTPEEAFAFQYSSASVTAPDSRHPWFSENYLTGAAQYMSNSYIREFYDNNDPRLRYYFYRQTTTTPTDVNVLDCIAQEPPAHYSDDDVFCSVSDDGYWGRDHLDDDGTPPDTQVRTTYGVYPAGGEFDADQGVKGDPSLGLKGQGIIPMLMPAYTAFMRAEAALELATGEDARDLLEEGVRSSIEYVMEFGDPVADPDYVPTAADVNNFVNDVLAEYDAAADKLNVVITQYWLALWGNGIDAYNTYRRTGKPEDLQPALNPSAGTYYRSFTYPAVYVTRNNTSEQKATPAVQVFWDVNPAGFVD